MPTGCEHTAFLGLVLRQQEARNLRTYCLKDGPHGEDPQGRASWGVRVALSSRHWEGARVSV